MKKKNADNQLDMREPNDTKIKLKNLEVKKIQRKQKKSI